MMKKLFVFLIFVCLVACGAAVQNTPKPSATPKLTATPSFSPTITFFETATIRPTATVTPDLVTYQDAEMKLRVSYPKGWVEKSRGVFVGSDGYLIIKKLDQYNSPRLSHVAIDFANSQYAIDKPSIACIGFSTHGCVIVLYGPSMNTETGKLVSVIPYYRDKNFAKYVSVETTWGYFPLIDDSIVVDTTQHESTPTPVKGFTPLPKPIAKHFTEGISIQEFPFFEGNWPENEYAAATEIYNDGNCGIKADRKNRDFTISEDGGRLAVKHFDKVVYEYASWTFNETDPDSFCAWDENWMFETHDIVVMNGKVLNHELGYDEMFRWHLLDDKPTFFVKNKGKYQISFDGKLIPFAYDEIVHDRCSDCENPRTDGTKTWFKARRENTWFMVVVSVP